MAHTNVLTIGETAGFLKPDDRLQNALAPETKTKLEPVSDPNAPVNLNVGTNDPIFQKRNVLENKTIINETVSGGEAIPISNILQKSEPDRDKFIDPAGNVINEQGNIQPNVGPTITDPGQVFEAGQIISPEIAGPGTDPLNEFVSKTGMIGAGATGFNTEGVLTRATPTDLQTALTKRSEGFTSTVTDNNLNVKTETVSSEFTTIPDPNTGENFESLLSAIVDSIPQTTEQVSARRNIEGVLNDLLENTVLNFMDLSKLLPESKEFVRQMMTGETEATRALQAKEASAMADGIANLMNNISAQAGAAGITGGELRRLYDFGIAQIAETMGDFAMNNIIRMGEMQQQGFNNFLNLMQVGAASVSSIINDIGTFQQLNLQQQQFDNATINQITALAATDPIAAQILQGWLIYQGRVSGASVDGYLNTLNDPKVQEVIQNAQKESYDIGDITKVNSFYDSLGVETSVLQKLDKDGQPMFLDDGTPVLSIVPSVNLNFDGTKWRLLPKKEEELPPGETLPEGEEAVIVDEEPARRTKRSTGLFRSPT